MNRSLEILDEISDRVMAANKNSESISQAEKWVAGAYWNLRKGIEKDLAEKSEEIRKEAAEGLEMAYEVGGLLDEIIEPFDKFGNMLARVADDNPEGIEAVGLSIMAMADGMRYRYAEFEKKVKKNGSSAMSEGVVPAEVHDSGAAQPGRDPGGETSDQFYANDLIDQITIGYSAVDDMLKNFEEEPDPAVAATLVPTARVLYKNAVARAIKIVDEVEKKTGRIQVLVDRGGSIYHNPVMGIVIHPQEEINEVVGAKEASDA